LIEKHLVQITTELGLQPRQVAATAVLLEEGATVPFIARYRKERTGELDEVKITAIRNRLEQLEVLDKRRESIIASLEERKLFNEELRFKVETASSLNSLEDIYLPFKPRKRTRATIAKELGLEPLSDILWAQDPATDPEALAVPYVGNSVTVDAKTSTLDTVAAVLAGAREILAERINDDSTLRAQLRSLYLNKGVIKSTLISGKEEEAAKFKDYFDWSEPAATAPSHRILAMRRGETEGFLYFRLTPPQNEALGILFMLFVKGNSRASEQVKLACEDCLKRLVGFAMEVEARGFYKKKADEESIRVFADNLRELLLASPLGQKITLGIDPGFRTGCKIVLLDRQGKLLANEVIYPGRSRGEELEAAEAILNMVRLHKVEAIAIGNGTASRETESFVKKLKLPFSIQIVVVSESGASIYSASEIAREEFPDLDLTVRGAVSIGRRLMDPLAELVKLDPKSIGVGQYQHDVDQAALKRSLDDVVISCVNKVGVELNTASRHLLAYVSGLNSRTAASLVSHRDANGPFKSRAELLKISGLGPKAFEQAAGFLRIRDGAHPLDASSVHPERYELVDRMAADIGCSVADLLRDPAKRSAIRLESYATPEVGLPTLKDIVAELAKPGRDPREQFEAFSFADGVKKMEDIQPGMKLPGIVTNVTAFGAFVDIGVHQDGLVHISQISDDFVKNPAEFLTVGQKVQTTVMEVDLPRKRIALSLKTKVELTPRNPKGAGAPGGDRRGQGGRGEDLSRFMRNDSGKPGTGGDWFSQAQQKKF